jgi:Gas vesicle synthesis protein GvpL/GvpF
VHERVVERIMADRAVLPMRFGSRLPDDDALEEVLAARQQEFLAALDRVRGRVEVSVRAMQPLATVATVPAPTTGREYLEAKLRNGRNRDGLHEPLASLAVAVSRRPAQAPDEVLRASYLVDTANLARFRATVERLQRANEEVAILCTGPWPPYSFVGDTAALPAGGM